MAIVICELCRDNDDWTEGDEVFLWSEKARPNWRNGDCDVIGNDDDFADYTVSLRHDVIGVCGGKSTDTADSAVGDGAGVRDGCDGGAAGSISGGGVVRDKDAGLSHDGGGVVCGNEGICGGDAEILQLGVGSLWSCWIRVLVCIH